LPNLKGFAISAFAYERTVIDNVFVPPRRSPGNHIQMLYVYGFFTTRDDELRCPAWSQHLSQRDCQQVIYDTDALTGMKLSVSDEPKWN
jgi:hypothetical protein